jgi:segregation and condensation protein B
MAEVSIKNIVEAALLASVDPLPLERLHLLVEDFGQPSQDAVRDAVDALRGEYAERGIELVEVAGGLRIQVRETMAPWVAKLWEEKPARYSRALLETLVLIAYRQPITRGEIEDVRGVAVSTHIMRTLLERNWVRIVGHRDVPGRPALYASTKSFLDYFGLKSLSDLPSLAEIKGLSEPGLAEGTPFGQEAEMAAVPHQAQEDSGEATLQGG